MFEETERAVTGRKKKRSAGPVPVGLVLGVLLLGQRATPSVPAQKRLEQALTAPVKQFTLVERPVIEGLLELAYQYQLPLAVEYMDWNIVRRPVKMRLRNVTVGTTIEALVGQLSEYRVSFSDVIVDLYSPRARRDPSNVLNITISRFDVTRVDAMQASRRLEEEIFAKLHPGVGFAGDMAYGETFPKKVTLRVDNRKVYEILNAIVAQDGAAMWMVIVPPTGLANFNWNRWSVHNLNPLGRDAIINYLRTTLTQPM